MFDDALSIADFSVQDIIGDVNLAETLQMSEHFSKAIGMPLTDSFVLIELLTRAMGISQTDNITLAEAFMKSPFRLIMCN